MPKILKRIICLLISLIFLTGCFFACSLVCNHPSEEIENTVSSFYNEPENSLDVVMIGSSATSKDFQPSAIWNKAHITSYNFSVTACSGNIYFSMLKEIRSMQPNALILIDIDGFTVEDKFQNQKEPKRFWRDSMPKNENRRKLIKEEFSDELVESYFPIIRYHRYMTSLVAYIPTTYRLEKKKLLHIKDPLGGATLNNVNADQRNKSFTPEKATENLDKASSEVFQKFLKDCKDNSYKNIVFVHLPKTTQDGWQDDRNILYSRRANFIRNEVEKYGYDFYDYNVLNNPANLIPNEDFADTLHLTTKGAVKFSEYLSQYLKQEYGFKEKDKNTADDWNTRYKQAVELMKY